MLRSNEKHSQADAIMTKTLTFTLMHFCIAFSVTYVLTGSIAVGGLVAAIEPLVNSVGFYLHERIWQRIERPKTTGATRPAHAWLHHQA
jgi:uncharacterized membrane protein